MINKKHNALSLAKFFPVFVAVLYLLRLLLCWSQYLKNYQWLTNTDETHVYLLGLRYFTSGQFPLWGPDITHTLTYLVGGLQGFLIGLPLFLWPHPFAPYLFLWVMESCSFLYLSWYLSKLFHSVRRELIYLLVAVSPVSIHIGLHVLNPAYLVIFAIPAILSFIEALNIFTEKFIGQYWRFFWMGLAVTTIFQLHGSWPVAGIILAVAFIYQCFKSRSFVIILKTFVFGLAGFIIGGLTLIPVAYQFGPTVFIRGGSNVDFSLTYIGDIIYLTFNFVTQFGYEMNLFGDYYDFSALLKVSLLPVAILFGVLQISGYLVFSGQVILLFLRKTRSYVIKDKAFLKLCAGAVLVVSLLFLFSFARPRPHMLLILYPLSAVFLVWCIDLAIHIKKFRYNIAYVFCLALMVYYSMLPVVNDRLPDRKYRERAIEAIDSKNPDLFEKPRYQYPVSPKKGF